MAKTKTKPGPKAQYGERIEIHVKLPIALLKYIDSVSDNRTKWIIEALRKEMERDGRR